MEIILVSRTNLTIPIIRFAVADSNSFDRIYSRRQDSQVESYRTIATIYSLECLCIVATCCIDFSSPCVRFTCYLCKFSCNRIVDCQVESYYTIATIYSLECLCIVATCCVSLTSPIIRFTSYNNFFGSH